MQGVGHTGTQFGEIAQFLLRHVDLTEQRIEKDLVEFRKEAVFVGGREIAQVEVIGFREPEQDLRGDRALVAANGRPSDPKVRNGSTSGHRAQL